METLLKFSKKHLVTICTLIIFILILIILGNKISFGEKEDGSRIIGESIHSIAELATTEYDYTYVEEFSESSEVDLFVTKLSIPLTNKYFVGTFDGTIKYGVDLNNIKEKDIMIDETKKIIVINMPEVIQLSHEAGKTTFYAKDNNLLNPFTPEDSENFKYVHKEDAENKAFKRGILTRIQKDTELTIQTIINSLPGYEDYKVKCKFPDQKNIKNGKLTIVE